MTLHKRLRALRLFNNLTQQDMAQVLGIHRSTYAYYELAKTRPEYETLLHLAALYDVDIEFLLSVTDKGR
mgnify:CR=1 FL=1